MNYTEAQTLYGTARELIAAVTVLHTTNGDRFIPSINLLIGYACEILLKSSLAQDGVPAQDRHGHDLKSLYSKADKRNLLEFSLKNNFSEIINIVAKAHKENSLRYLKPGSSVGVVTSIETAISALNALDEHVRQALAGNSNI